MDRIKYVINIVIVALLFCAIAISRDGRVLGEAADEFFTQSEVVEVLTPDVEMVEIDGTRVINSTSLATDVVGFAGRTPVKLYIKNDVIQKVEPLENSETPSFFRKVVSSGIFDSWNGLNLTEAAVLKVDDVSGATYSSRAVAMNVQRAVAYGASVEPTSHGLFEDFDFKSIVGLVVILIGVVLTMIKSKNKIVEVVYMVLNIVVLGFWCGSFLSLAQFVSWMSNGFTLSVTFILLLVVILLPIFGRKGSYCHMHCPMGSAQELLNRIPAPQLNIKHKVGKILNRLRYCILMALLVMMWIGVGFEIMDYEVFSAFLVNSASNVVLVMAAIFLVLSLFIKRPYCRFVCPTGAMITIMQKTKES
ncbi:MAG: 4Fe-4S binding protein [Rikenellaceae bacterium]